MLRSLEVLPESHRDLVFGYCHQNSTKYIPKVVGQLTMIYLWILESFTLIQQETNDKIVNNNKDINNEEIDSDILIKGINKTIIQCQYGGITSYVYGTNVISSRNCKYYHWRFRINNDCIKDNKSSLDNEYNFIIGIKSICSDSHSDDDTYLFIGSHGLKSENKHLKHYTNKRFNKSNDVLDMYLKFENGGQLSFVLNNESLGVAFNGLDIDKQYKIQTGLKIKESTLELIGYHSSKEYMYNNRYSFEYINYIRSIVDVDEKIKHLDILIKKHNIQINEIYNDYIDCLVNKQDYQRCYSFIESLEFDKNIDMRLLSNIRKIGSYFYFQRHDFKKALKIFKLMPSDDAIIDEHICVEYAFSWEQDGKNGRKESFFKALKYYEMGIKYETKLQQDAIYECLHHMGAIYFNYLADFRSALNCFLKMGDLEINHRDLESVIASCYDQLKEYHHSLKYFKKYQTKYKNKPSVIIAIASIYFKSNNIKKADKWFLKALDLKSSASNWQIQSKYGYYLLNCKHDYLNALKYFEQSLKIAKNDHEIAESYKCIGATYDKLGDMDKAIKFTDKVLEINNLDADALNNAGYFYLMKKDYKKAHQYLQKSLEIYPDGELTTGNFGILLYEMGKFNESIKYLKKAIYDLPSDLNHVDVGPRALQCYASILFKEKKDYNKAIEILLKLIKHKEFKNKYNTNRDEIYYLLSRVYSKLMDFQQSLKYLNHAKQINPRQIYLNQIKILKNAMAPDFDVDVKIN